MLPASLVIINDIFAYLFGFFFGRTPLIKISPKKTWEGFLGALFTTVCVSYHLSRFLASSKWFVCPRNDLTIRTWCVAVSRRRLAAALSPQRPVVVHPRPLLLPNPASLAPPRDRPLSHPFPRITQSQAQL